MVTLKQFLEGASLKYKGPRNRVVTATFKLGDGISLKQGRDVTKARVPDELGATRFYHNVMRGQKDESAENVKRRR